MQVTLAKVAAALLCSIGLLACGGNGRENSNLTRGRELLSIGEPDAAVRELRLALKSQPRNGEAKALLLVALLRSDEAITGWYEAQILFDRLRFLEEHELQSLDGYEELSKQVTSLRQTFYDHGLDTRDAAERWEVTARAARYSLEVAGDAEKDYAAFALALHGADGAVDFLVDRLKSEKADYLPGLIARLGGRGEDALLKVAGERENLGRARALDTLARLRERQAAERLFEGAPDVRGLADIDVAAEYSGVWPTADGDLGLSRDQALYGIELHGPAAAALRVHWVTLDANGASRLLVMQGYDQQRKEIVTRFHHFTDGALVELHPNDGPELLRLATEGPITRVERSEAGVTILQLGRGSVPSVRERKRSSFKKGDRVRVRANKKAGVVRGVDEFGLLVIDLEPPNHGSLTLTPSAVLGLDTVLEERIGLRAYQTVVNGEHVDIKQDSDELRPITNP